MDAWDQIKNFTVGKSWTRQELAESFDAVRGAVALPGKRPGFAVVAGLRPLREMERCDIYLLAEYESADLRLLLRQCMALGRQFNICAHEGQPFRWIGDAKHGAAAAIVRELNEEYEQSNEPGAGIETDRLWLVSTPLLDMTMGPHLHLASLLREFLEPEHRQLFLQGGVATERLGAFPTDLPELQWGEHPCCEALAFLVADLRDEHNQAVWDRQHPRERQPVRDPMDWI